MEAPFASVMIVFDFSDAMGIRRLGSALSFSEEYDDENDEDETEPYRSSDGTYLTVLAFFCSF